MSNCLGRLAAVPDLRVPRLARHMDLAALPPIPDQVHWHAMTPAAGWPMLGNDRVGCCVFASALHYLQMISLYRGKPITPTETECLEAYSAVTGYDSRDPTTDNGSVVMGPGGMIEYWHRHGLMAGGELNKCGTPAVVDFRNVAELQAAIYLFGAVFMGANLTQNDADAEFLWLDQSGRLIGGHEFLFTGFTRLEHTTRYDILTWDGMRRTDDVWVDTAMEEAVVVYDEEFFDLRGLSPGGFDRVAMLNAMRVFA